MVGAVVAALVLEGAEKTGEKLTEGGLAAIGRLVDRVRGRFRDRSDVTAEAALVLSLLLSAHRVGERAATRLGARSPNGESLLAEEARCLLEAMAAAA